MEEKRALWPEKSKVWKQDVMSGFLVSLLALPLCLGIAAASGFPPVAGVTTAIVGGVVCGLIGGAPLTIKGPAAGLIVIVLAAVQELGAGDMSLGYKRTLAVGVCAAFLQMVARLFRLGRFAALFPSSVVHGMLAAIGVIIFVKQSYVLIGVAPAWKGLGAMLWYIPQSLMHMNPLIACMGVLGVLTMFVWPHLPFHSLKRIPAPLVVVLFSLGVAAFFDFEKPHTYWLGSHMYQVGPQFLLTLPHQLSQILVFPDWSAVSQVVFWKHVAIVFAVASLESLLTVKAVEKIDPLQRTTNPDDDLWAVGCGNMLSAFLGGLPMISEIVRSSANIHYKAQTGLSNVFHGVFLAVFIVLCPGLLSQIPMAALASMLVYAGCRLASPKTLKNLSKEGWEHVAVACVTLVLAVLEDLLVGILVGVLLDMLVRVVKRQKHLA